MQTFSHTEGKQSELEMERAFSSTFSLPQCLQQSGLSQEPLSGLRISIWWIPPRGIPHVLEPSPAASQNSHPHHYQFPKLPQPSPDSPSSPLHALAASRLHSLDLLLPDPLAGSPTVPALLGRLATLQSCIGGLSTLQHRADIRNSGVPFLYSFICC